jgi:hypothetical protein
VSSSSIRGTEGVEGETRCAGAVGASVRGRVGLVEVGGVWRALPSTMFAILATSRSRGAILDTIRSNSCLTSEGGGAARAGAASGAGPGVVEDALGSAVGM